ncbi:phosphatase and actin regulator 2 isoform X3 [Aquarana catesbeiana]|uniref:phosphatase and actin regulator 2 isoform X3 n=1 Tax=Aquarana catesbeiana TaxID=8400 RepID=UPI003CC9883E
MAYSSLNEDRNEPLENTDTFLLKTTSWKSKARRVMATPGKQRWSPELSPSIMYYDGSLQDLFTRARSKSDTSSFAQVKLLRVRVAGSVDGLDKASIANSDAPNSGNQSPPLKRKGRLSSIGKIFKPWKWRKKKASEKFRETSAVLERKISMRQSREELIRRGVLKEIPDHDGEVPINMGTSNGHTVPISEEPPKEQKSTAGNGAIASKASVSEEKAEHKKESTEKTVGVPESKTKKAVTTSKNSAASAGPSHRKDEPSSKKPAKSISKQLSAPALKTSRAGTQENNASSSNRKTAATKTSSSTLASTSSRPKASKEQLSSKAGISTTPRAKKLHSKSLSVDQPMLSHASSTGLKKRDRTELATQQVDSETQETSPTENSPAEELQKPQSTSPAVKHNLKTLCNISDATQEERQNDDSVSESVQLPENRCDSKTSLDITGVNEEVTESDVSLKSHDDTSSLKSQEVTDESFETSVIPDGDSEGKGSQTSDSDSDGPILYTDDDDDDDDSTESTLASKIRRRDTLAIKLGNRPSKKDLEDKNILPRTSEEERQEMWQQIGTKLVRRLSQRPTSEELEQRNILKQKNEEEEQEARRELKRRLTRKLSLRPSVAELQARRILCFNEYVEVTDSLDYDRRADKPWARLTPADKAAIRKELNEFKSTEMEVHEESRHFTRFHRP